MRATSLILTACLALMAVLGLGRAAPCQEHPQAPSAQLPVEAPTEHTPPTEHGAPQHQGEGHGAPAKPTLEMENDQFFKAQYEHVVAHRVWPVDHEFTSPWLHFYNVNVYQWVALLLIVLFFLPVLVSFGSGGRPGWITRVLRGWCRWIRDEMVYSVMGKDEGRKYAPYFIYLFFFITLMNCIGLVPSVPQWGFLTATATATPYVTGAMALVTFAMMLFFGMKQNGVLGFVKGLLPHGLPMWLIPLMLVVEIVGLLVKPFALMIRLFANMLAGHLVIASLIGLIFLFAKMQHGAWSSYLTAIPGAGMAIFIFIIEAFVTLLQAYIFTYLSIIFVHQAVHQAH